MNSFIPNGIPIPVFLADKDGDGDADIFGITKEDSKYKAACGGMLLILIIILLSR